MSIRRGLMMQMANNTNAQWRILQMYATRFSNLFRSATLPETFELDLDGFLSLFEFSNMFTSALGAKTIRIKNYVSSASNITLLGMVYYNSVVERLEFVNCEFAPQNFNEFCRTTSRLEEIVGELDFSNATNVNHIFNGASKLREVRFKANTLKISMAYINTSPLLSDASLISIANGLNGSVTGQSITLHETPKARCGEIMGANSSGAFVASDSGTLSLADFITTVKGWTLA